MKIFIRYFLGLLVSVFALGLAVAGENGTKDEAVAMVKKAIAHVKAKGKDAALADFTAGAAGFKDRDLYVYVWDLNGKALAHGANSKLIGKDLLNMKDGDGKELGKALVDSAKKNPKGGWVDYKWVSPVTKVLDDKVAYIEVVDDMLIAVGYYK